ncbi:ubiquitin carboxyl-terminal hydrolase 15-like protein [Dinothrombium tinctorium]|uniref:Ubiquitin carboxyl-terminal hydrolase n=1 Tax=Dinothrombium tinctorium TaxID=1965070 RepID=A0A3S3QL44_9ACAR|nr:ubiquitin carboxyl-terminal hydrolase 15-like protein [Dinothrombium tinctorium]RWS10426.1 ubiquitin carboxyl-terminal hydrolase 15-like protein [Dinothrombium tinctorium]RWS10435.1 ubiquitin carboxyl-terminal hydrolase 15-like protein [Dinothrombium tinctorium]
MPAMEVCSDAEDVNMDSDCGGNCIDKIFEMINRSLRKDDFWFLVDRKWFEALKQYVNDKDDVNNPGPINNAPLFKANGNENSYELKERLQEDVDFVIVPEDAWRLLVATFGIVSPKHEIKRQVILQGKFSSYCIVEIYLFELKLCLYGSKEDVIVKSFSRVTTLATLEAEMKKLFNIDESKDTQLWAGSDLLKPFDESGNSKNLDNQPLFEAGLHSGAIVTLEVRNADGTWPSSRPRYGAIATRSSKCTPGLCGLMNLGNTCFMNSALQCMSNTPPLTEYFISDKYVEELNTSNPLGMGGEIANSFGDLMKAMWSGAHTCLAPREFKLAVGRFAPQFSGFQQQDCQELMAFLLDGLHEDLNRVKQKPYIELKTEVEKRPDEVVAAESWSNYKKRNDSIIVDTFHGLLKSTLVCPECELVSVTFDPFCYLSLPLPVKRERAISVTFIPSVTRIYQNGNQNIRAVQISRLMVPKYGIVSDICNAVAKIINESNQSYVLEPDNLIVAEVSGSRFHKLYNNDDTYTAQLDDVVVYEVIGNCIPVPVYLREVKNDETTSLFGRPMIVNVHDNSYDALYESITLHLKQFMKVPSDDEESDTDEGVAECERTDFFSLTAVNNYGSLDIEKIDRNKPLKLGRKTFIAADFTSAMKDKYYDQKEAESVFKISVQRNLFSGGKTTIALSDCIAQFTTTERLGADDPWYCPRCKKHQQATKKFDLWSLPKVLIIHLKRFSYSKFCRDKLDTFVDFPVNDLNMGEYIINNPNNEPKLYDLIAVANHYGGLGGGHYTAYAKNRETEHWHYFDDSNVSLAPEENVVSKAAYVLFYLRKD